MAVFFAVTALAAYASRASLARPRSHGFFRFFAWEAMLVLVLVNFRSLGQWFRDPLSARQLASWLLLFFSLVPLGLGVHLLHKLGQPDPGARRDPTLFPIEQTTQLVTTGIFRYIRHPIYASLLLLTWGVFLKQVSWIAVGLAAGASLFLLATAAAEERENAGYFGPAYDVYRRNTKRLVPFLF